MNTTALMRRLALTAVALCLAVVVLGAYVRLTAAGLGCPDWPGCYGEFIPTAVADHATPFDLGKAWREMSHRYAAATLGVLIVILAVLAIRAREPRPVSVGYAFALLATVLLQGMLGMLTVTWQLKPLVVTLHLLFGLTTLALLWWLYLGLTPDEERLTPDDGRLTPEERRQTSSGMRTFAIVAFLALGLQIALGGWTSSNYAAVACPDFPTCQRAWWPDANFADAFVLWRGLGIDYEGGVLEHPSRVAIHFTHRLGAAIAGAMLLATGVAVLRSPRFARARRAAMMLLAALVVQFALGISMVREAFPLGLATAHNAGAALLVLAMTALCHRLRARA
jgi:heme a synthase